MKDFFDQHGAMPARPGCRRAYHRFYLRGKGILHRQETYIGVFTRRRFPARTVLFVAHPIAS